MKKSTPINRRKFVSLSATLTAATGTALAIGQGMQTDMLKAAGKFLKADPEEDTRDVFKRCGACSHTFYYILNKKFGVSKPLEETASDTLAGGMMLGEQCGMLWGSSLAVGSEAYRTYNDPATAMESAVRTTQYMMQSFQTRTGSCNCRDVIGMDITHKLSIPLMMVKIIFQGGLKNSTCFRLADKWAPEATATAVYGLSCLPADVPSPCHNCAAEVVKRKGGTPEEMVTVSGLAGGMGLSGLACGALGSAVWKDTLDWCRKNPGKSGFTYGKSHTSKVITAFKKNSNGAISCEKITGRLFANSREHAAYMQDGGCEKIIDVLSRTSEIG